MLVRHDLATGALREWLVAPGLSERITIREENFGDEAQGRIFALLAEHVDVGLGAVFSDERARALLDEISALQAAGEMLYPSADALRAAWFRLVALNRERAKLLTDDFDEKYRLHGEMKQLRRAAAEASNLALES